MEFSLSDFCPAQVTPVDGSMHRGQSREQCSLPSSTHPHLPIACEGHTAVPSHPGPLSVATPTILSTTVRGGGCSPLLSAYDFASSCSAPTSESSTQATCDSRSDPTLGARHPATISPNVPLGGDAVTGRLRSGHGPYSLRRDAGKLGHVFHNITIQQNQAQQVILLSDTLYRPGGSSDGSVFGKISKGRNIASRVAKTQHPLLPIAQAPQLSAGLASVEPKFDRLPRMSSQSCLQKARLLSDVATASLSEGAPCSTARHLVPASKAVLLPGLVPVCSAGSPSCKPSTGLVSIALKPVGPALRQSFVESPGTAVVTVVGQQVPAVAILPSGIILQSGSACVSLALVNTQGFQAITAGRRYTPDGGSLSDGNVRASVALRSIGPVPVRSGPGEVRGDVVMHMWAAVYYAFVLIS